MPILPCALQKTNFPSWLWCFWTLLAAFTRYTPLSLLCSKLMARCSIHCYILTQEIRFIESKQWLWIVTRCCCCFWVPASFGLPEHIIGNFRRTSLNNICQYIAELARYCVPLNNNGLSIHEIYFYSFFHQLHKYRYCHHTSLAVYSPIDVKIIYV